MSAGSIPRPFIDDLIARVDIVEIIAARITLRKSGVNYSAPCPFHNEKQPSFTVSQTKQFYYCFGCGAHGNAIGFLMEYDHMGFVDAIESLAAHVGLEVPKDSTQPCQPRHDDLYSLMEEATRFYQRQLRVGDNREQAIHYLKGRGLSGKIAKQFGMGLALHQWDALLTTLGVTNERKKQMVDVGLLIRKDNHCYDRFRNRIMFPIRDQRGRAIGFGGRVLSDEDTPKYLNSPESPIFHKGNELYGLYEVLQTRKKLKDIIVVEGYLDVISLFQYGIDNVVATLGTATNAKHLQKLFRYCQEVVFCFDGDNAGKVAAWRALEASLPLMRDGMQISFSFLPVGEDPDSLVRSQGQEGFLDTIKQALPLSDFLFQELSEQVNLEKPDGRARLAQLASPLLNKMPTGIFKQLMFEKLSEMVKMDVEAVKTFIVKEDRAEHKRPRTSTGKVPSSMQLAIMLLLQHPELTTSITDADRLKALELPKITIFTQLIELLKQNPKLTTGGILEHWGNKEEAAIFARLAATDHIIPQEGVEAEFLGALERLVEQDQKYVIEQLLAKANNQPLNDEDRTRLHRLINREKER